MSERDFAAMSVEERSNYVKENTNLTAEDLALINSGKGLSVETACNMVEHTIGVYGLPYCIAPGFVINGKKYTVPMVSEEPYVVSSTAKGAKVAAECGGFKTTNTGSVMIGQVQILDVPNPNTARLKVLSNKEEIIEIANKVDPVLVKFGGGCKDVEVRAMDSLAGPMVVVHLIIDCKDAMGAQAINAMVEAVSGKLEELTGGKANIKVLSNLAVYRLVTSRVTVKKELLGGEESVDKIVKSYAFAEADPYRATTNNKGVMNGIIPVVIATGNDTRAVESGVHSWASITGKYKPITVWEKNKNGDLEGMIEIPMPVGIVGGTTRLHPMAQMSLKMMDIKSAIELAEVIASVGLSANLGVLHSLVTVGLRGDFDAARNK